MYLREQEPQRKLGRYKRTFGPKYSDRPIHSLDPVASQQAQSWDEEKKGQWPHCLLSSGPGCQCYQPSGAVLDVPLLGTQCKLQLIAPASIGRPRPAGRAFRPNPGLHVPPRQGGRFQAGGREWNATGTPVPLAFAAGWAAVTRLLGPSRAGA